MKLSALLPEWTKIEDEKEISSLCFDSREAKEGSLYFCIPGGNADGHSFAYSAVASGATAIVVERLVDLHVTQIVVPDARKALALAAARFYGEPAKKLKLIGITGTNGKTTTTYIVESILKAAGLKTGVIGTSGIFIGSQKIEAKLTTPDPTDFHAILAQMVEAEVDFVVMEVSAHSLALRKMFGVQFDVTAFTNFSRDHLDFFGDMDTYFDAKRKLFTPEYSKFSVFNADDDRIRALSQSCAVPNITFGYHNPADVFGIRLSMGPKGLRYIINHHDDIGEIKFSSPGKFNMYNTLCAATICGHLGIALEAIQKGIAGVEKIEGRFQIIPAKKCNIIVDFAHTDDGLTNILSTIREFAPKRVLTVFGCGGDRDRTKRPLMGKIVSSLSDYCFITSDNPRTEPSLHIMRDIRRGVSEAKMEYCKLIEDRKEAIKQALEFAEDGDVLLVAGKGAEKYMEIGTEKIPYNDEEYILELLKEGQY